MNTSPLKTHNEAQLRLAQLKMLDILLAVDTICRHHALTYWLDNGTLLGAVRHGGFIPWDDDMDIAMPMKDYERFAEVAPNELPEALMLLPAKTTRHTTDRLPKIVDTNSFYVENCDDLSLARPHGIYIDITPFIDFPTRFVCLSRKLARAMSVAHNILNRRHYYTLRSFAEFFYFTAKYAVCRLLWAIIVAVGGKGSRTAPATNINGYGLSHERENLFPLRSIVFESCTLPAPACPEKYLTEAYGDWKTVPPPEKRKIHAVYINPELSTPR